MKSHRFLNLSIVVCLAAMGMASIAEAQRPGGQGGGRQRGGQRGGGGFPGGGRPGGGQMTISRAQLLRSDDIKEEVNINDAQGATIEAAIEAYQKEREESRPDFEAMRDMSEEERTAAREKMTKQADALNKKTDEMLNALLEEDQIERLDEISLQLRVRFGLASVLKSDDLKKSLSVKDEQIAKLEDIEKEATDARNKMFEEMRAAFRGRGRDRGNDGGDDEKREDRPDPRQAMEDARKKVEAQVMAVLTDDQKAKLKEMQGNEFEIDMRSLMGGRGGRGGDRGGDRGRGGDGGGGDRNRGDGGGGGRRQRPASDDSTT